ncbi:hypothetical protein Ancab_029112 [Ancistrocladus abbreviatus]
MGEEEHSTKNPFEAESRCAPALGVETETEPEGEEEAGGGGGGGGDEEGEEDGEDDIEEADCMNPLDFVEDDASGVQLYQQFERLEYEALAERKRKAFADNQGEGSAKKPRQEEFSGASYEELMEVMGYGRRRRSKKEKKKLGRRKGSKKKVMPEVTMKLGKATVHYAHGRFEEAICLLNEVVRLAPNMHEPYHMLGLVYNALGDKKKAMGCYMIAAFLGPKDSSLWKPLVNWSIEQGNIGQAWYCLTKAINADPGDAALKYHRASLYVDIGDHQKAAEAYEQIFRLCPDNVEALKKAIMLYEKCSQFERSVSIFEDYLKHHPSEADLGIVDVFVSLCIEKKEHVKALQHIEDAKNLSGRELPLYLTIKEGICHANLGDVERAEICFSLLQWENANDHMDLITAVANSFMSLQHYESALKYYLMIDRCSPDNGFSHLKIAQCYLALERREVAIEFFYKALQAHEDDVDARLSLASLLLEEDRVDEAIYLLSPPASTGSTIDTNSDRFDPWWHNGKIKLKLSDIYRSKGMLEAFVDAICPLVRESLTIESMQQKGKQKKRLSRIVLSERVKVLEDGQSDSVFGNFRRPASKSDLSKANRAKRLLEKKATLKEEKKSAALAAGLDWESDDSDEEALPQPVRESPLPDLLKDEEHYCLIKDLCKALASLRRYTEALEIIKRTLRLSYKIFPSEKKEELRSLGSQIALNVTDPSDAIEYVRYMVLQHPESIAAWNCYYKLFSRLENRHSKHSKFVHHMRVERKDLVPPTIISGNQLTVISQHQAAAREYLEAYKLMPDNPLINLCVGTALVNLALGHRLQNKHQCVAQGLAFLYNNLRLCGDSQEAFYNIARAYHHVGLVSLAASYYEKVLTISVEDYPLPELSEEDHRLMKDLKPGYCDLRREAAYNLHLIYKKSGAVDLARQVLKDHCTL